MSEDQKELYVVFQTCYASLQVHEGYSAKETEDILNSVMDAFYEEIQNGSAKLVSACLRAMYLNKTK